MDQIRLGDGGPSVSRLGLGTAYFGTRIVGDDAGRMVGRFIDAGGTLVDTANCYGRGVLRPGVGDAGASERTLGAALSGRRNDVILASKVGQRVASGEGPDGIGLSRTTIKREVEASLRRLQTDRIDLYQCHLADPNTPVDETLRAMGDLVSEGKVRWVGVSNWDGWQVIEATSTAGRLGIDPIVSNQVWYNVADRQVENSVIPACDSAGVGIIAYSALAQGFLVGGFRRSDGRPAAGSRLVADGQLPHLTWDRLATDRGWDVIEAIAMLAHEHDVAPSTVALRWLLAAGSAAVALIGPRDQSQMEEFLLAGDAVVPAAAFGHLTTVSRPEQTYPRSFTETYARPESPMYGGLPDLRRGEA